MTARVQPFGVIGAGAWGTALAQVLAARGAPVWLWAHDPAVADAIERTRENLAYLPGVGLSPGITATGDLARLAAAEAGALIVATPAQHMRAVLAQLPRQDQVPLILCAKGIEAGTHLLMHEVAAALHPARQIYVLSGPTFAREVALGLPTAVTLAGRDLAAATAMAGAVALPAFRPYPSNDVVGAEIGGAVKNVLAIACGVVDGLGLGENARAALISRGFAEMTRFGVARGARADTLAGLSGLGDLVLTCSSASSRNFSLGVGLGRGAIAGELLGHRRTVAEGAFTAPVLRQAATAAGIDMPIVGAVCALIEGQAAVGDVVGALLARPLRSEG